VFVKGSAPLWKTLSRLCLKALENNMLKDHSQPPQRTTAAFHDANSFTLSPSAEQGVHWLALLERLQIWSL